MRVLHLWDSYAPGLFDRSFDISRRAGLDVRLACMNFLGCGAEPAEGVSWVRRVDTRTARASLAARAGRKVSAAINLRRFRRLVRRTVDAFDPDVVHVHYGTTGAALVNEPLLRERPFVISFYGFDISQGVKTPAIASAYRQLMERRPLVHVLCDEAADRAIELGADPACIVDANLPLPVERYPYTGFNGGQALHWLIPARFVAKKGHEVALRAFADHLRTRPDDRLTCWGYGDSRWLRRLVDERGLAARVAIIDNQMEGPFDAAYVRRLAETDAVLTPSVRSPRGDDEGGPALTSVLAQVAGKPVIVSDFPGHERSVTDGVEGFVVPQGDATALAVAMTQLSADRKRAAAMGKAGRARALQCFNEDSYRDSLLHWYARLTQ